MEKEGGKGEIKEEKEDAVNVDEMMEMAELMREEEAEAKDGERKGRRRKNREEELQLLASCQPSKRAPSDIQGSG